MHRKILNIIHKREIKDTFYNKKKVQSYKNDA